MTVIAYDGRYVAADKQSTNCGTKSTVTKLFQHGEKVIAVCGSPSHGMEVVFWLRAGAWPDKFPRHQNDQDAAHVYVFEHGKPVLMYENSPIPFAMEDARLGFGSGGDAARAAMFAGTDALRAVAITCAIDSGCGMGIDWFDLEEVAREHRGAAGSVPAAATGGDAAVCERPVGV